jgi:hypothetical protein
VALFASTLPLSAKSGGNRDAIEKRAHTLSADDLTQPTKCIPGSEKSGSSTQRKTFLDARKLQTRKHKNERGENMERESL